MNASGRQPKAADWERRYSELKAFVRIHGHARIANTDAFHAQLLGWLKDQQALAVIGALAVERWWRLAEVGIDLEGRGDAWERRIKQLIEFRKRFGHFRVPAKWEQDIPFGSWVHAQRAFKKKGKLSAMRIALLEDIGFEWAERWIEISPDEHWERMCEELDRYRKQHGHTEVLPRFREHPGLGEWVRNQREANKQGVLRPDRRERLEAMGFAWQATRRADRERWEQRFAQMLEFRKRFGHCRVPARWEEDVAFGTWVQNQRAFKSRGTLSRERIQRLRAVGFDWTGLPGRDYGQEDHWMEMFERLLEYQKEHGDTQVPPSYQGHGLGRWVQRQREAGRKGTLEPERREHLDGIGFEWRGVRKADAERWERRFEQLVAYRQRHGNCRVPSRWREDAPFAHWVDNQRAFKKAGKLSPERIRRLEEIGFNWRGSERI